VASYCSGGKGNKENSEVLTIMLTGEFVSSVARKNSGLGIYEADKERTEALP